MPKGKKTTVTVQKTVRQSNKGRKQHAPRVQVVTRKQVQSRPQQPRQVVAEISQENQWKHGFYDPETPARGPGTSQLPTIMLTYRSSTPITVVNRDTVTTPPTRFQLDTVGGTDEQAGNGMLVITPLVSNPSDIPSSQSPYSGLWCSPGDNLAALNSTGFSSWVLGDISNSLTAAGKPSQAPWVDPLNASITYTPVTPTMLNSFQGAFPVNYVDDTSGYVAYQPYRVAGLRATLTQTSNALSCQGFCACGDFGNYMASPSLYLNATADANGLDTIEEVLTTDLIDYYPADGNNLPRFKSVGALEPGAVFEAVSLPVNEQFWRYHNTAAEIATNQAYGGQTVQTLYSSLQLMPSVGFVLQGILPGNSFMLNVTLSIEVQNDVVSPLAFLYNQSRFTDGYFPNLRDIRTSPSGGALGDTMAHRCNCSEASCALMCMRMRGNSAVKVRTIQGPVTAVKADAGSQPPSPEIGAIDPAPAAMEKSSNLGSMLVGLAGMAAAGAASYFGAPAPLAAAIGEGVNAIGNVVIANPPASHSRMDHSFGQMHMHGRAFQTASYANALRHNTRKVPHTVSGYTNMKTGVHYGGNPEQFPYGKYVQDSWTEYTKQKRPRRKVGGIYVS